MLQTYEEPDQKQPPPDPPQQQAEDPQDTELDELDKVTTIDETDTEEERNEAFRGLMQLLKLYGSEEHHSDSTFKEMRKNLTYIGKLVAKSGEAARAEFFEDFEALKDRLVFQIMKLRDDNGGQANQMEEVKQPTAWERLGISQAEYERRQEEGAGHGREADAVPRQNEEEVAKKAAQQAQRPPSPPPGPARPSPARAQPVHRKKPKPFSVLSLKDTMAGPMRF